VTTIYATVVSDDKTACGCEPSNADPEAAESTKLLKLLKDSAIQTLELVDSLEDLLERDPCSLLDQSKPRPAAQAAWKGLHVNVRILSQLFSSYNTACANAIFQFQNKIMEPKYDTQRSWFSERLFQIRTIARHVLLHIVSSAVKAELAEFERPAGCPRCSEIKFENANNHSGRDSLSRKVVSLSRLNLPQDPPCVNLFDQLRHTKPEQKTVLAELFRFHEELMRFKRQLNAPSVSHETKRLIQCNWEIIIKNIVIMSRCIVPFLKSNDWFQNFASIFFQKEERLQCELTSTLIDHLIKYTYRMAAATIGLQI